MIESKNHLRGVQLFELGRFQEAISYLSDAISESIYNYPSKYYLALCYFNIGDYGKSSKVIDELLQETPNEGNLFFFFKNKTKMKQLFQEKFILNSTAVR